MEVNTIKPFIYLHSNERGSSLLFTLFFCMLLTQYLLFFIESYESSYEMYDRIEQIYRKQIVYHLNSDGSEQP